MHLTPNGCVANGSAELVAGRFKMLEYCRVCSYTRILNRFAPCACSLGRDLLFLRLFQVLIIHRQYIPDTRNLVFPDTRLRGRSRCGAAKARNLTPIFGLFLPGYFFDAVGAQTDEGQVEQAIKQEMFYQRAVSGR